MHHSAHHVHHVHHVHDVHHVHNVHNYVRTGSDVHHVHNVPNLACITCTTCTTTVSPPTAQPCITCITCTACTRVRPYDVPAVLAQDARRASRASRASRARRACRFGSRREGIEGQMSLQKRGSRGAGAQGRRKENVQNCIARETTKFLGIKASHIPSSGWQVMPPPLQLPQPPAKVPPRTPPPPPKKAPPLPGTEVAKLHWKDSPLREYAHRWGCSEEAVTSSLTQSRGVGGYQAVSPTGAAARAGKAPAERGCQQPKSSPPHAESSPEGFQPSAARRVSGGGCDRAASSTDLGASAHAGQAPAARGGQQPPPAMPGSGQSQPRLETVAAELSCGHWTNDLHQNCRVCRQQCDDADRRAGLQSHPQLEPKPATAVVAPQLKPQLLHLPQHMPYENMPYDCRPWPTAVLHPSALDFAPKVQLAAPTRAARGAAASALDKLRPFIPAATWSGDACSTWDEGCACDMDGCELNMDGYEMDIVI